MEQVEVHMDDGRRASFEIEKEAESGTFFILGVRKCGSSILNSIVESLAKVNDYNFVDVAGKLFQANILEDHWRRDYANPTLHGIVAQGNVYGGFRARPFVLEQSPFYGQARKILLVRDPRDALVSEYFSNAYSHALPGESAGGGREEFSKVRQDALSANVNEYVRRRTFSMNETICEYADVVHDPMTKVFRYEDVILHKRQWLADMADWFDWDVGSPEFVDAVMGWADVVPSAEASTSFIRKVTPGDHKEKLSATTIRAVNVALEPSLALLGYEEAALA